MFAPESVELLQKSGIDFERHEDIGILPNDFAELVITSGLVLTDETRWISFHRFVITAALCPSLRKLSLDSGYDFGYFMKLLTALSLPTTEEAFFEKLQKWFPVSFDMKTMMRAIKGLKGGLQDVADDLGVNVSPSYVHCATHTHVLKVMRIGPPHQAGSDSLLTASTFFKMRELYFRDMADCYAEFNGKLYGLGETFSHANGPPDPGRGGATPAEREDRRVDGAPPVSVGLSGVQVPSQMPPGAGYGPLGTNGAFIRTIGSGGGGGR
jgi:CCR4-NOT transcription complex subunit 7/8